MTRICPCGVGINWPIVYGARGLRTIMLPPKFRNDEKVSVLTYLKSLKLAFEIVTASFLSYLYNCCKLD